MNQTIIPEDDLTLRRSQWSSWLTEKKNFNHLPVDPYKKLFYEDSEILELNLNPDYFIKKQCNTELSLCVMIPCCAPLIALDLVSSYFFILCNQAKILEVANAKHLILRENSLVFRIDKDRPQDFRFELCETKAINALTTDFELVFSLDDPIELVKSKPVCTCFCPVSFIHQCPLQGYIDCFHVCC